jgi:anti-sigma factor RsiW
MPDMNQPDCATVREWLSLDADGELPPERHRRLEQHLESCAGCAAERRDLERLQQALAGARLAVRPDFRQSVMAALPAAGWEGRAPRAWRLPVAVFALLAAAAALVLGATSPAAGIASSALGALAAVAGLLEASALAGAGLLAASWKGVGLIVAELLASPLLLGAFLVLIVCLNLLLFSLLRRRRPAAATRAIARGKGEPRD